MATTEAIQEFATLLAQETGMAPAAALAWAQEENGPGNNILGVSPGGKLAAYPSIQNAVTTVANMINSPQYASIKAALVPGTTADQQLQAIINSPWNTGKANDPNSYAGTGFRAAAFGTSPDAVPAPSSATSTTVPAAAAAPVDNSASDPLIQSLQQQVATLTSGQQAATQLQQQDAFATITADLQQYGLSGLGPWLQGEIQKATPNDQILLDLQNQPQFQARFPALQALQQAGLPAIDPATYLSTEAGYRGALQKAGIDTSSLTPQDYVNLFTQQVDPTEMTDRLNDYHTIATTFAPAMQQAFLEQIGEPIAEPDIYKMFNGMAPQQVLAYTQRTGTPVPTASDFKGALQGSNTGNTSEADIQTQMQRVQAAQTSQFAGGGSTGPSGQQTATQLTTPGTMTY